MFPQTLGDAATENEKIEARQIGEIKDWQKIFAAKAGYVQDVDADGLLEHAAENKILIRMRRSIGQFAATGATLAEIAPDLKTAHRQPRIDDETNAEINDFFTLDRHRTIEKDAGFGIRQIVDIALKALSPGINDTTTAVECIDQLGEIVGEIARRKMPAKVRSKNDVPRVIIAAPDFDDYVETAFDQIRISGKANLAIFDRLLSSVVFVGECTDNKMHRHTLEKQIELIGEYAVRTLETDYEKEKARLKLAAAKQFFSV